MKLVSEKKKLLLDGKWELEELSDTIKEYIQLYGFAYSLIPNLPTGKNADIEYIYAKFPWRGGYSTVNFFNNLFHKIPKDLRPQVLRIQYASPGFIELNELLVVAGTVAGIVASVTLSIDRVHNLYRKIQRGCIEHKLAKIDLTKKELELNAAQIQFATTNSKLLAKALGLTEAQENLIDDRTQGNQVAKLKILLSTFRRVHPLAQKQADGKINI